MARQARIKDEFGIFYIHQVGGIERLLFENDEDRIYFLNILKRTQVKFQYKLFAYCLLSDNEYHLIIDVNGGDLSKIMKSINIGYAMHTKCQKPLFKDRYKSEMIKSEQQLLDKIQSIHKKAEHEEDLTWNSFCHYNTHSPLTMDWIPVIDLKTNNESCYCNEANNEVETCHSCIRTMQDAKAKLNEWVQLSGLSLPQFLKDKERRNTLIREFRRKSTLSLKELGILFGGLSESTICKILNNLEN